MYLEWNKPKKAWGPWEYTAVCAGAVLLVARYLPPGGMPWVVCPLRWLTGWPCLTCGLTRATLSLAHGEWMAALHYNPLGILLGGALALYGLWALLSRLVGWKRPALRLKGREKRWCWALGAALLLLNYAHILHYHRPWERGHSAAPGQITARAP